MFDAKNYFRVVVRLMESKEQSTFHDWELYIRYCQVCLLYTWLIKVSPMKEKGIKSIPQVYWLSNHNGNVLHIKI